MNGFGIEKKDSVSIYNSTLMPNMDKLTFEHIFSSVSVEAYDFKEGYKAFSIGTKPSTVYTVVEEALQNGTFVTNETIKNNLNEDVEGKIHLMIPIEDNKLLDTIGNFIQKFRSISKKEIWVHPVLMGASPQRYRYLDVILNKVKSICDDFENVKIGIVMGKEYIFGNKNIENTKKLYRMFINEVGEKWMDTTSKFETLYKAGTNPNEVSPFVVKTGFKLNDNDVFYIMNFEPYDCSFFTQLVMPANVNPYADVYKNIKITSLFPVKNIIPTPYIYEYAESKISVALHLQKIEAKMLIITTRDRMKPINYYFNGLKNTQSPLIQFAVLDENNLYNEVAWNTMEQLLNMNDYTYLVVDYDIGELTSIKNIKEALHGMDAILGKVNQKCKQEKWSLFISSLYGMRKKFEEDNMTQMVNFSLKVPVIVADRQYPKNVYRFESGSIYELAQTIYKNIKEESDMPSLLKKQGKGFSIGRLFRKR